MGKKLIIPIIAGVAALVLSLAAVGIVIAVNNSEPQYTVNIESHRPGLEVPETMELFSGKDAGIRFLYPAENSVRWDDSDGAYIYGGDENDGAYVLIYRMDKKGMTPKKYFKDVNKLMLKTFDSVQSTKVMEVPVQKKTLYVTRYLVTNGNKTMYIERYVELYDNYYVQYTAVSKEAGEMNTALYYAIDTLSTREGTYKGEFSEDVKTYKQSDTGITIELPEMLDTGELTIGYLSHNKDALILCVLCQNDDLGNPIYNRQNFIDRAAENPEFVAGYLGAQSAAFGNGKEVMLDGRSFYEYPMEMSSGGESYTGEIYLANSDKNGVYLVCYAVRNDAANLQDLIDLCKKCAESIQID